MSLVMKLRDSRTWRSLQATLTALLLLAVSPTEVTAADPVEINPPYPAVGLIKTVTLEVTPEQVEVLALADRLGDLTLSIRPPNDASLAERPNGTGKARI